MEDAVKFLLKDKISEFKDLLEEEDEVKTVEENPLKTVREFQKNYRVINDKIETLHYTWQTNSNSSGELKQKNILMP